MASKLTVTIDRDECTSCGQCWEVCSDFFEQSSDDDFCQVVEEFRIAGKPGRGEVPEELEAEVKEAAEACPVEIIHVEEKG
jgi:ferredoxin